MFATRTLFLALALPLSMYADDCQCGGVDDDPAAGEPCPDDSLCGPELGMPNTLCDDGVTWAGPTGSCLALGDGTCAWEVATCPEACAPSECGPALGMPNTLCPDGVTVAGPTGECSRNEDGECAWVVIACP